MLLGDAFSQLASVIGRTNEVIQLAQERSHDSSVISRAASDAKDAVEELGRLLAPTPVLRCNDFERHLGWLARRYREGRHEAYQSDIDDIRNVDLPAISGSVADWERSFFDPGLVRATERAWRNQDYVGVVRDAFVHVEERLRTAGDVAASTGLSGDALVTRLLGRGSADRITLPSGAFSPVTTGEEEGVYYLFKGMFLLFRNAAAHRAVSYSASDAQLVVGIAELCLRLIDGVRPAGSPR